MVDRDDGSEVMKWRQRAKKYREALEFYAELNHVKKGSYSDLPHGEEWDMYHRMAIENGHKARQALDDIQNENEVYE